MNAKSQILSLLPSLSLDDAKAVQAALKQMHPKLGKGPPVDDKALSDDWLLGGIGEYLRVRGLLEGSYPLNVLGRHAKYPEYVKHRTEAYGYLAGVDCHERQRPYLAFIAAEALSLVLEREKHFFVSSMLSQVGRIPEAIDTAYPGYYTAGVIPYLLPTVAGHH